ncbi:MAG: hypothetical protein ACRDWT_07015 [Jatrophihabitantaceae bacterium]
MGRNAMMRWNALFADLEAQAEVLEQAERAAEVQERTRAEVGALTLLDRLRPAVGLPVRLRTAGAGHLAGTLDRLGPDWALLEQDGGREVLVRLGAVTGIGGLGRTSAVPGSLDAVTARLGLWFVLRRIARDRSPVSLHLTDGTTLAATLDRVGADYVEVAVHAPGEARRAAAVRDVLLVPTAGLVAVRREL